MTKFINENGLIKLVGSMCNKINVTIWSIFGNLSDQINNTCPLKNIAYGDLKMLRDNGMLIPGQQYRIIDYITTTTQANTQSTGHQFDVIVTADDESTLNEIARACLHEGDTYFSNAGANLEAWQIWYCLDNDTDRFAWAQTPLYSPITNQKMIMVNDSDETYIYVRDSSFDSDGKCAWLFDPAGYNKSFIAYIKLGNESLDSSDIIYTDSEELGVGTELDMGGISVVLANMSSSEGKGVIYRMIDEWNNDVPYDFKNIQFKRKLTDGVLDEESGVVTWVYTFNGYDLTNHTYYETSACPFRISEQTIQDAENDGDGAADGDICKDNQVLTSLSVDDYSYDKVLQRLNDIVFLGVSYDNGYDGGWQINNCHSNSFGSNCNFHSFGSNCHSNSFGSYCNHNSFGSSCYSNSFGSNCNFHSFGSSCNSNSFGCNCNSNSFGSYCDFNSFGDGCYSNSFVSNCGSNSFGCNCYFNSFGDNCCSNSFGDDCQSNSFGIDCDFNSFGNSCSHNSFKNGGFNNSFGNSCYSNSFGTGCYSNSFGNDCDYNTFGNNADTPKTYYQYNSFGDGCRYINLANDETASSTNYVRNYKLAQGLQGTSSSRITITTERNRAYETKVAKNSSGEVKIYCEADLIA